MWANASEISFEGTSWRLWLKDKWHNTCIAAGNRNRTNSTSCPFPALPSSPTTQDFAQPAHTPFPACRCKLSNPRLRSSSSSLAANHARPRFPSPFALPFREVLEIKSTNVADGIVLPSAGRTHAVLPKTTLLLLIRRHWPEDSNGACARLRVCFHPGDFSSRRRKDR